MKKCQVFVIINLTNKHIINNIEINKLAMEQIFALMILLGAFTFIFFGICVGNSIEAKENKRVAIILTGFTILGVLSLLIGLVGLIVITIFF